MQNTRSLTDWLQWLETLHPQGIDMGLDRVTTVAERLRLDFSGVKVVTVAGTNGKGSCVATLEALLRSLGETVGAYTSPHFLHYNERVRINGADASDQQLCDAFAEVESARGDTSLTYFEYGTLAAFVLFLRANVDYLVLEVGLGGRLDAVNIVDADIAIVTSVDLDHQDWLGNDRESIGLEKAGIFRANRPALCADCNPPLAIAESANKLDADLLQAPGDFSWTELEDCWEWRGVDQQNNSLCFESLPLSSLPTPSLAVAIQAFLLLGKSISNSNLTQLLQKLQLPGRCQSLQVDGKQVLLDVAHNPAAARYLAARLSNQPIAGSTFAVLAVMADKDIKTMLSCLKQLVDTWQLCELPDIPRAAACKTLADVADGLGLAYHTCDTVDAGFQSALALAGPDDRILVMGSFYTVAAVLEKL